MDQRGYCPWIVVVTVAVCGLCAQGCVSLQASHKDGRPKLIGWGTAKPVCKTDKQIYKVTAPGLSLRICSWAPGFSLGWHETRLFYPPPGDNSDAAGPVAIQTRCFGFDFMPTGFELGYHRTFGIPFPVGNAVQSISYIEQHPEKTTVNRKQLR